MKQITQTMGLLSLLTTLMLSSYGQTAFGKTTNHQHGVSATQQQGQQAASEAVEKDDEGCCAECECCKEGCTCCEGGTCACENCTCCGEGGCCQGGTCQQGGCCQGGSCQGGTCQQGSCCEGGSCECCGGEKPEVEVELE